MTPLYHARKSDGRWFVRAFALLIADYRLSIIDHRRPGSCTAGKCICTSER